MKWFSKLKNRGFTLVEVVIAIAMLTVVGGAITSFIVASQKQYNMGSAESDLQYEAQLVVNQFQELVIDAAKGVSYAYNGTLNEGSVSGLIIDDSAVDAATIVNTKEFHVYDVDKYYKLSWDTTSKKLFFFEYEKDEPDPASVTGHLLAEYVTGFSVDLRDVGKNRTVKYMITLKKEGTGREYTTTHKIKLRNEVLVNKSKDEIYAHIPTEIVPTKITLSPDSIRVWPGGDADGDNGIVSALVTGTNGYIPSVNVDWHFEGNTSAATKVDAVTNRVKCGWDEQKISADDTYKFTAYATKGALNSKEQSPADTVSVYVRRFTGWQINALYKDGHVLNLNQNVVMGTQGITLTAELLGVNIEDLYESTDSIAVKNGKLGGVDVSMSTEDAGCITVVDNEDGVDEYISTEDDGNITVVRNLNGVLKFNVNDDIAFAEGESTRTISFTFYSTKPGFDGVARAGEDGVTVPCKKFAQTVNLTIMKRPEYKPFEPISEEGWTRRGYLGIDFTEIRDNPDYNPEDYGFYPSESGFMLGNVYVEVVYYYYDRFQGHEKTKTKTYLNASDPQRYSNQGAAGKPANAEGYVYDEKGTEGLGSYTRMRFKKGNPFELDMELMPTANYNNWYMFHPKDSNIIAMDGAEVSVIIEKDGVEKYRSKTDVPIAPVTFSYYDQGGKDITGITFSMAPKRTTSTKNGSTKVEIEDTEYQTQRVYFKLSGGWNAKNDEYVLNPSRYAVCLIDPEGKVVGSYYAKKGTTIPDWAPNIYDPSKNDGYVKIDSSESEKYVEFSIRNDFIQEYEGYTLQFVYEGDNYIGYQGENSYTRMNTGCLGSTINFKLVGSNIAFEPFEHTEYQYVTYQNGVIKNVHGKWNAEYVDFQGERCILNNSDSYNDCYSWIYCNRCKEGKSRYKLVKATTYKIDFMSNNTCPSTDYCPPPAELEAMGIGINGRYYIDEDECFLINDFSGVKKMTYERGYKSKDGSYSWEKRWLMNSKDVLWMTYVEEDNMWKFID